MSEIIVTNTRPEHGEAVSQTVCAAYHVPPDECSTFNQIASGDDIRVAIERFAEGQFVALDGDRVVGMASTMRVNRPPSDKPLTWMEQIGDLTIANHDPNGEWLYGVELAVHPDYRRRGIGIKLYDARFALVRRLNLRAWYAVGMLMGYGDYRDRMSVRDYGEKVIRREITDPTVTMQMNRGFRATMVVENYLDEPQAGDAGALIIWDNPDYHETYQRTLKSGIVITSTRAEHAEQLEQLQKTVFPTLAADELFRAPHYRKHLELFPEGQFVALDGDKVVGMTSTIRYKIDFDHPEHTFPELLEGGWMTSHDPDGDWLYGMDMGTHPDYRKRGIARGLYHARQETVHKLGLKGQIAGGMMSGYGAVKDQMSAGEYFAKLKAGEIYDPTISTQMRVGFRPHALLPNYLTDPICDNWGVLIVLDGEQEVESS